jgi:hypothetical protein
MRRYVVAAASRRMRLVVTCRRKRLCAAVDRSPPPRSSCAAKPLALRQPPASLSRPLDVGRRRQPFVRRRGFVR